jgi:1-phosphofructokinase
MILTLTLNPSLDHTLAVERFAHGAVSRVTRSTFEPGGKGVNVAQVLTLHDVPVTALMALGGPQGRQLVELLESARVAVDVVAIAEDTRSNVTIEEPSGVLSRLSVPGPHLSDDEVATIGARLVELGWEAEWVVLAGALPSGMDPTSYAHLLERLRPTGAKVAIDTSGDALHAVLDAGADLLKPNVHELAETVGRTITSVADAAEAASELHRRGARCVLASLGADGAVLVDETGAWSAASPPVRVVSSIGAGDSMVAGFLARGGRGPEALAAAVCFGAAAVALPGTQLPSPRDLDGLSTLPVPAEGVDRSLASPGHPVS